MVMLENNDVDIICKYKKTTSGLSSVIQLITFSFHRNAMKGMR